MIAHALSLVYTGTRAMHMHVGLIYAICNYVCVIYSKFSIIAPCMYGGRIDIILFSALLIVYNKFFLVFIFAIYIYVNICINNTIGC